MKQYSLLFVNMRYMVNVTQGFLYIMPKRHKEIALFYDFFCKCKRQNILKFYYLKHYKNKCRLFFDYKLI